VFVTVRFFTIGIEAVDALKEVRERQIRVGLPDESVPGEFAAKLEKVNIRGEPSGRAPKGA
jgi:hypothetical protein